jgi:TRAP-type C4-dicarboxylate transport system permease small subunit
MNAIEKLINGLNRVLIFWGGIFLVLMIALTCANIVFRASWVPVRGTFELMGYAGAVVAAFALGHTQLKKSHIAVDVLVSRFSPGTKHLLNAVNSFLCMVFFGVAAWQIAKKAATLFSSGEVTETLRIIYYPFTFCAALGCATLALVCFAEVLKTVFPKRENNG